MPSLQTRTFGDLLSGAAAAVQSQASGLVDMTVGSIARAIIEAFSGITLWLQGLVLSLLAATRASTSVGADLDSWIADWAAAPTAADTTLISRLSAAGARGQVTFSRLIATGQAVVPIGSTVGTADGSQSYVVTADTTAPTYSAALGGYVLIAGVFSVTVPVAAQGVGAATNAVAGAVTAITSAIPGIDAVTNAAAFTSGLDAESDAAYLARFRAFLRSLREATPDALRYYINSLQPGVQSLIVERELYDGTPRRGYLYAVVDDGTGAPSSALLYAAGDAIDGHHAAGVEWSVYAPVVVPVNVVMALAINVGGDATAAKAAAKAAVTAYLNGLPLGTASVPLSKVYQVAHDASADIAEVTSLTLNTLVADVALTVRQLAKAGTVTVS